MRERNARHGRTGVVAGRCDDLHIGKTKVRGELFPYFSEWRPWWRDGRKFLQIEIQGAGQFL